jgi:hypothetical protein
MPVTFILIIKSRSKDVVQNADNVVYKCATVECDDLELYKNALR